MSGSTIGGVVGAAVGFWFGGPEGARWGWMAGSLVGGAVDPDVIRAPSIGDAQTQTSQAGVPIPRIYGKPQRIKCNIIDGETKARKIIVESQQGKGGPVVEEERFLLTSAFGVCNGPIAGIQRIFRNGEPVIDLSVEAEYPTYTGGSIGERLGYVLAMRAKTASWSGRIRVYLGDDAQLPDPSLEAIHGVGNTPYFRGLAYFVVVDDDVTQMRGRANVWEVEPIAVGVEATDGSQQYVAADYAGFNNNHWPLVGDESDYTITGYRGVSTAVQSFTAATIAQVVEHFADFYGQYAPPDKYLGYSADVDTAPWNTYNSDPISNDIVTAQPDATNNAFVWLIYNQARPDEWLDILANSTACPLIPYPGPNTSSPKLYGTRDGHVLYKETDTAAINAPPGGASLGICFGEPLNGGSAPDIVGWEPLWIKVERKRIAPVSDLTPLPESPGYGVNSLGVVERRPTYEFVPGTFKVLRIANTPSNGNGWQYTHFEVGPAVALADPNYNSQAYWEAQYALAVAAGTVPAGWTYNVEYPVGVSGAWLETIAPFTTLQATDVTLQSVWEDLAFTCARVPVNRLDASALGADIIPGYLVATNGSVADALRPTQQGFFFDTPDYDGAIRCIKRGGAAAVTITDDDLLEQTDEDRQTEPQALEFPRAVHVMVPDPDAGYTITPQTAERYSPDVRAVGESSLYLPIPFRADRTKQIAGVMLKVAWAQAEGRIELPLPEEFSQYVASDCFNYLGKRWRIEETTYADGEVRWKAVYDRASAYTLSGEGVPAGTPTLPGSGLAGPTQLVFLNVPQLDDADDRIGLYVAVAGAMDGWSGATIQARLPTDTNWREVGSASVSSVMGELTAALATGSAESFDAAAETAVQVYGGELSSTDFAGILNEQNLAVIGESPTQEVVQFQTATAAGGGAYTLAGFARARLDSPVRAHLPGERFVLLNAPVFCELPVEWLGREIELRAVTNRTDPDSNASQTIIWQPPKSLTEWGPFRFVGSRDGSNNITLSWIGRGRMGTTLRAFNSIYFDGYRVTLTKGTTTVKTYTTAEQSFSYPATQQTADFGSATGTLTVRVEAINRFTGPSAALTGTVA